MQLNSIRFKTNILFTLILGIILIIHSAVLYHAVRNILYRDQDQQLSIKAKQIADIIYAYDQLNKYEQHPLGYISELFSQEHIGISKRAIIDQLWQSEV